VVLGKQPYSVELTITSETSYEELSKKSRKSSMSRVLHREGRNLWHVNSKQAAQHFVLSEKNPERFAKLVFNIDKLWGQSTCKVMQCSQCGFCFSYPYVAGDERFYSLAYVRSGYPKWKWEFQITYDVLRMNLPSNGKLIEIGAGDGAFINKIAKEVLPKANIF